MNNNQQTDFIGIFDDVLPEGICERYIEYFQELDALGFIADRMKFQNKAPHIMSDRATGLLGSGFIYETKIPYILHDFIKSFWDNCYQEYIQKYSILDGIDTHQVYEVKIQKTVPGQGYHVWHCETTNRSNCNRILTFILYLNDVQDGGETEFLYYPKRISPKKNRLILWPAGFTHTHRGNQPLSGEKYVLTGWIEL